MTTPFPFVANTVLNASQLNAITTLPISAKTASATLVVGDVGYRVQMTSASATTITVNTSIFSAGDTIWIQNMGTGVCTITSGTCTVSTASNLALAQYGGGTLVFQSASAATFFSQVAVNYGTATGGTSSSITVSSQAYTLLAFTTDANLVVSKAGLFDVLLVGGGAGGGLGATGGGGGGGGGVIGIQAIQTVYLAAATYAIDVAAGGASESVGLNSAIATVVAVPGGGFGGSVGSIQPRGSAGGSGGGGSDNRTGGSSVFLVGGFAGGNSPGSPYPAGGGGGSAGAGGAGLSSTGGTGGNGTDIASWITGATYYVGAGGGGGSSGTGGLAGNGGVAGKNTGTGNNGVNYGAGGGGSLTAGGAGAQGVVYLRFKV